MSYILATNHAVVRWYSFDPSRPAETVEIIDRLDLARVPMYVKKEDAKRAAEALGLKTWRYVRI